MLLLGQWIDLIMFKEKGSEKERSEIDNESQQAYQTLVDWVKTVPNTIDELKKKFPCRNCGKLGHWEAECSQPKASNRMAVGFALMNRSEILDTGTSRTATR